MRVLLTCVTLLIGMPLIGYMGMASFVLTQVWLEHIGPCVSDVDILCTERPWAYWLICGSLIAGMCLVLWLIWRRPNIEKD